MATLSKSKVKNVLDDAMGNFWGGEADKVLERLRLDFPKRGKTIDQIEQKAVDAAQEREEPLNGERYYDKKWHAVMSAVNRLFDSRKR